MNFKRGGLDEPDPCDPRTVREREREEFDADDWLARNQVWLHDDEEQARRVLYPPARKVTVIRKDAA